MVHERTLQVECKLPVPACDEDSHSAVVETFLAAVHCRSAYNYLLLGVLKAVYSFEGAHGFRKLLATATGAHGCKGLNLPGIARDVVRCVIDFSLRGLISCKEL